MQKPNLTETITLPESRISDTDVDRLLICAGIMHSKIDGDILYLTEDDAMYVKLAGILDDIVDPMLEMRNQLIKDLSKKLAGEIEKDFINTILGKGYDSHRNKQ